MNRNTLSFILLLALSFLSWQTAYAGFGSFFSDSSISTLPDFSLATLDSKKKLTQNDIKSCASLIVIWASWCGTCKHEHPFLVKVHKEYKIPLYGIDYVDNTNDVRTYLAKNGNPFKMVGLDESGQVAERFNIKGVPESFVVDKNGKILYHHFGALDQATWESDILPKIKFCEMEK